MHVYRTIEICHLGLDTEEDLKNAVHTIQETAEDVEALVSYAYVQYNSIIRTEDGMDRSCDVQGKSKKMPLL